METNLDNVFFPFSKPRHPTAPRAPRLPIAEWTKHRPIIEYLYIGQDKSLDELVELMKRVYSFHATPRQYTQRFKAWQLHKNTRRTAERKPRSKASIYQSEIGMRGNEQTSDSATILRNENTPEMSLDIRRSIHDPIGNEEGFLLHGTPGMVNAWNLYTAVDASSAAAELDGTTALPGFTMDEYLRFLDSVVSPVPMDGASSMPASDHLTTFSRSSICSSAIEEVPNEEALKTQTSTTMAVWSLWYSEDFSQLESLFHAAGSHDSLVVDILHIYPSGLDLRRWLALYPRRASPELTFHHLPFPDPKAPNLTWEDFAEYGHIIASQEARVDLTSSQCEEYVSLSARRVISAMLLTPDGSRHLCRCFNVILTNLRSILEDQIEKLDVFTKYGPLQPCWSNEDSGARHDDQENSAAILAMVCKREGEGRAIHRSSAFGEAISYLQESAKMSLERAFVWAARLMLYHSSSDLGDSPLPSDLSARALDGCRRILAMTHPPPLIASQGASQGLTGSGNGFAPAVWQDSNFASLWAEWICHDSNFFLQGVLLRSVELDSVV